MQSDTVPYTRIHTFFDVVHIDEIKTYVDNRGLLSEVFRSDDKNSEGIQQCYISETGPYVCRGPHQHSVEFFNDTKQTDNFISWKNRMVYYFYDPVTKTGKHFITDPSKIYRLQVPSPIVHSYRNLDDKSCNTLNFPTALFKGKDKAFPIDEVRHEHKTEHNKTYIVLGAGGRLGKSMVEALYNHVGDHTYDIIPVFTKFKSKSDVNLLFNNIISNPILHNDKKDVIVINCVGLTTKSDIAGDQVFTNSELPLAMANSCLMRGWKFIHFSTDYVYKNDKMNNYTYSKKLFEELCPHHQNINILRVSNLFSLDKDDKHNFITKFASKIKNKENVVIDPKNVILPTSVSILSDTIVKSLISDDTYFKSKRYFNLISDIVEMNILLGQLFDYDSYEVGTFDNSWIVNFLYDRTVERIYLPSSLTDVVKKINMEFADV